MSTHFPTDNTDVSVIPVHGWLLAMTESTEMHLIDPITLDTVKSLDFTKAKNLPKGHYQVCAFNFQGMAHVSRLKIEILVEFDEIARRRHYEQKHSELEHLLAEAGLAPEAAGSVNKEGKSTVI